MDEVQLARNIEKYYSLSEIESLCFSLNIDSENIEGTTKASKSRNLVTYLSRRNKINNLVLELQKTRPDAKAIWNNIPPEINQSNLSEEASSMSPAQNVYGDVVYGDKVDGDKINVANQNENTENNTTSVSNQPKNKTNYLPVIITTILIITALGIIGWTIYAQQPTEEDFVFQVRVQDQSTQKPISNAQTTLDIEGEDVPKTELTDTNGLAIFSISSNLANAKSNLTVNANGYQIKIQVIQVEPNQLPIIVTLENQ